MRTFSRALRLGTYFVERMSVRKGIPGSVEEEEENKLMRTASERRGRKRGMIEVRV